jgi:hypothetical protein
LLNLLNRFIETVCVPASPGGALAVLPCRGPKIRVKCAPAIRPGDSPRTAAETCVANDSARTVIEEIDI